MKLGNPNMVEIAARNQAAMASAPARPGAATRASVAVGRGNLAGHRCCPTGGGYPGAARRLLGAILGAAATSIA